MTGLIAQHSTNQKKGNMFMNNTTKRHDIWTNDESAYDTYYEEEEDIYDEVQTLIEISYDDMKTNLNVNTAHQLIAIGTLERWDKAHSAYKELKSRNVAEAIDETISSFGGDNTFHVYVEDEKLMISQTGHDNPTNPSYFEIRMLSKYDDMYDYFDDNNIEHTDTTQELLDNTESIGAMINKIFNS